MRVPAALGTMDLPLTLAALAVAKATLLFLAAWAVTLLLRRRSAALRHLVWSFAIVGAVMLPAVSAWTPMTLPLLPAREVAPPGQSDAAASGRPVRDEPAEPETPIGAVSEPGTPIEPAAPAPARPDVARILLAFWALGVLALLARFLRGARQLRGIVARAEPAPDGVRRVVARGGGGASSPDVRLSDEVDMPFAYGLRAPAIVLPAASRLWTAERREAVLLHELAHLSRGDLLMNALSHLARALYWFHPLSWYASHRLRVEAERACDDAVLSRGARASEYADHLLSIATGKGAGVPGIALAMARPSAFEGRLLAILEPGLERGAPSRLRVALTAAAFLIVLLPLAAASPTARAAAMPVAQDPAPQSGARAEPQGASSAVSALVEALADGNAAVRLAAANSLGSLEDPRAIAALGKALKDDSDPRVREAAAQALGQIDDPRAVPHLLEALKGERVAAVREQIVEALQEIDDPSALSGVAAAAKDPSAAVRRAVVSALGEFEDQSAVPVLIGMARDDDVEVRRHVADALGNLESPSSFDVLVTLTRDADEEVRSSAVNALGGLEDPRSLGALVAALKDASADVRGHAADAIQEIPDLKTAPRALIEALADPNKDVRHNVASALGEIGDEAAVPALKRALGDTDAHVRRSVAEALSEIGGPEAITALMGLLKDQDPEIRRVAAEALGKRR